VRRRGRKEGEERKVVKRKEGRRRSSHYGNTT